VDHPDDSRPPGRLRRYLRRWGGIWLTALILLGLSQGLWWWETTPVRQLLDQPTRTELGK
jgi:hypothetical protein